MFCAYFWFFKGGLLIYSKPPLKLPCLQTVCCINLYMKNLFRFNLAYKWDKADCRLLQKSMKSL